MSKIIVDDIVDYYFFESNVDCPVCEKNISLECYENHGIKLYYKHLLAKNIQFHCPICKELCKPYDFLYHYHGGKDICIWCRKSWITLNEIRGDVKHSIPCYLEFLKNVFPPHIPNTKDYFTEDRSSKKCPICHLLLQPFSNIYLYGCTHEFHTACISDWIINYNFKKCPICFRSINVEQHLELKKFGFTIEKMKMAAFFSSDYFLNVPTKYTNFYFNTLNEYYKRWSIPNIRKPQFTVYIESIFIPSCYDLAIESILYSKWTFERFLRRFTHALKHTPSDKFKEEINWHFKSFMIGLTQEQEIDTEMLKINNTCAICLDDFNIGNKVKILICKHFFHEDCIEKWFQPSQKICPLCKQNCGVNKMICFYVL